MNILMVARISGTRNGMDWPAPGEMVDLPDNEAAQLVRAGLGKPAVAPEPETAVADAVGVEMAVVPRPKRTAKPKV